MTLTLTDMFCGAGGSSTGAIEVPGVEVRAAANHWQLAVDTHNTNHPEAEHICADISQINPRYFPASGPAVGVTGVHQPLPRQGPQDRLRNSAPSGATRCRTRPRSAAERRCGDVVRFAEHHQYQAIMVENVVEAADWLPFRAWLLAMDALGYDHQFVSLNSMHAHHAGLPAPQSRDRLYVVFHRKGNPKPDLDAMQRPWALCTECGEMVRARQSWKPNRTIGRYRSQYVYRCPNAACRHQVVEPAWLPAASIIDWSNVGQRIGNRAKPLAEKTRRRIAAGIARYWAPLTLEHAGNTYDAANPKHPQHGNPNSYYRAWPTEDVLRTLHTIESKALAVPVGSTWSDKAVNTAAEPWPTFTTNDGTGLVMQSPDHVLLRQQRRGADRPRCPADPDHGGPARPDHAEQQQRRRPVIHVYARMAGDAHRHHGRPPVHPDARRHRGRRRPSGRRALPHARSLTRSRAPWRSPPTTSSSATGANRSACAATPSPRQPPATSWQLSLRSSAVTDEWAQG